MAKLKLSYFGHIVRREGPLEKTIILEKIEGGRKRGRRPRRSWVDSIKEAVGMSP